MNLSKPATEQALAAAFLHACMLDVTTLKPGNVSESSPGHRMTAAMFVDSAAAAAPLLCEAGAPVGRRILQAVRATQIVANCNTNLGIVLLCAPIAAAAEGLFDSDRMDEPAATATLRRRLALVLRELTVADADDAFRAIALANPGGLGSIDEHDVQAPARIDLRAAMRLAADRDLIARQYANDGADLFDIGLRAWRAEAAPQLAMQRVYLEFLARFPDSHIMRKHGIEAAQAVLQAARQWRTCREVDAVAVQGDLAKWDAQLKSEGLNPGTSADLAVATAFLAGILAPCAS